MQRNAEGIVLNPEADAPAAHPRAVPSATCPTCEAAMAVTSVTPVTFGNGRDDIVFRCPNCGTEIERLSASW
jgi:predicted RNA-binding Zn-ribbon protein involved in translation (DUF1610 family)